MYKIYIYIHIYIVHSTSQSVQLVGSSQVKGSSAQGADSLRVFHGSDSLVLKKLGTVLSSRGRAQRPGLGPGMGEHQKIPSFDGAPEKLATYRDEALAYTFTLEIHKRYLAGPRLAQSLTGVARTVIRRKLSTDPQWLAHPRGAYTLIDFLEQAIEQPTLVQASQHIQKFFYQLRRKRGETMTEWVNRHSESLWEASRALKRVEKEYAVAPSVARSSSPTTSQQGDSRPSSWWDSAEPQRKSEDEVFDDSGRLNELDEDGDGGQDNWSQWGWRSQGWSWGGWSSWKTDEYQPPQSWETDVADFLPDYLCGFLLLHRSGLDAHERANILAAIRGVFSVRSVERALKEQWSDDDLAKRDKAKFQSFVAVEEEEDQALLAEGEAPDFGDDAWAEEVYWADQAIVDSALAAIQEQKRTLKEARWRQSQMRLGRKFYPVSKGKGYAKGNENKPASKCLKCGGPHSTDNCPVKRPSAQIAEEHAEVAFSAGILPCEKSDTSGTGDCLELSFAATSGGLDLPQTIKAGKGVIDCGATEALGSVSALESIMALNVQIWKQRHQVVYLHRSSRCGSRRPKGKSPSPRARRGESTSAYFHQSAQGFRCSFGF